MPNDEYYDDAIDPELEAGLHLVDEDEDFLDEETPVKKTPDELDEDPEVILANLDADIDEELLEDEDY